MEKTNQAVPTCEGLVFISSDPDNLAKFMAGYERTATVEAEYGDRLIEGTILSLAHHGSRSDNPAPCNAVVEVNGVEAIGISHIDLDTVGGIAAILGVKPEAPSFWKLAEFVDVNGVHKLSESGASNADLSSLYGWYAWSAKNRYFPPRDGSILDATEFAKGAIKIISSILDGDEALLAAGDAFEKANAELNKESFVTNLSGVIVRAGAGFVNHLYVDPTKKVGYAVVGFNTVTGACTVSFADAADGQSAIKAVQEVFLDKDEQGNLLAGGHKGIAGSPRGRRASWEEWTQLVSVVEKQAPRMTIEQLSELLGGPPL